MKESHELEDNQNKKVYHSPLLLHMGSISEITKGASDDHLDEDLETWASPAT